MKVFIEEYNGYRISFDTEEELFIAEKDGAAQVRGSSLRAVKYDTDRRVSLPLPVKCFSVSCYSDYSIFSVDSLSRDDDGDIYCFTSDGLEHSANNLVPLNESTQGSLERLREIEGVIDELCEEKVHIAERLPRLNIEKLLKGEKL